MPDTQDDRALRMECLHMANGSPATTMAASPPTTEEILGRAREFFDFITGARPLIDPVDVANRALRNVA